MEQSSFSPPPSGGGSQDASSAQQAAGKVAGQAQEKAQQATAQVRDRVRDQVGERSTQAGEQVASTASDIRSVAEELRSQGKDQPAKLAEQVADRAEQIGGYLKESDADRLLHDLEEMGRRKPWAIGLGGVLAGVAAGRFLKASSRERYQTSQYRIQTGPDRASGVETVSQLPSVAPAPTFSNGQ